MAFRIAMAVLWLIAIAALVGATRLPRLMDIYIKDYYVAVSKWSIIVFIVVVLVAPLSALTIRLLRTAHR